MAVRAPSSAAMGRKACWSESSMLSVLSNAAQGITRSAQTVRSFGRDTRLLLLASAVFGFAYFGVYGVLLNLYALRLGFGLEFVGVLNGIALFAYAGFSLPAAAAGMRWGSRRAAVAGVVAVAMAGALLPVDVPAPWRGGWLVALYALVMCGGSLYAVNATPFMMATARAGERHHAFAVSSALNPLAAFAGNLAGGLLPGLLAAVLGTTTGAPAVYRYPLWLAEAGYVIMLLALRATREVQSRAHGAAMMGAEVRGALTRGADTRPVARAALPAGLFGMMALVLLLRMAGQSGGSTFFTVHLDIDLLAPTCLIGSLAALAQLCAAPAALAAPLVMARLGLRRTFVFGSLAAVFGLLLLALVPAPWAAGLGLLLVTAMGAITNTTATVFHQELVPVAWRPMMSGAASLATGAGIAIAALSGGYVIAALGYGAFVLIAAALALSSATLFAVYFRVPRGAQIPRGVPVPAIVVPLPRPVGDIGIE